MAVGDDLMFENTDSATHTVVFTNGLCSVTLTPGDSGDCKTNFSFYVGTYSCTVDGKSPAPLHGRVSWNRQNPLPPSKAPFQIIVLARHDGRHSFERIATVPVRFAQGYPTWGRISYGWKLNVQPGVTTTYIAKVTSQLPRLPLWAPAMSRPFTVRIRQ